MRFGEYWKKQSEVLKNSWIFSIWVLFSGGHYAFKTIMLLPFLISILFSANAMAQLMTLGFSNPVTQILNLFNVTEINIQLVYFIIWVILFILYESHRLKFKLLYGDGVIAISTPTGHTRNGKSQRFIALFTLSAMTFFLISIAIFSQMFANKTLDVRFAKEANLIYNKNDLVRFNDRQIKYYKKRLKIYKSKSTPWYLKKQTKTAKTINQYTLKNMNIKKEIKDSKSLENNISKYINLAVVVLVEVLVMFGFFKDVLSFEFGNEADKLRIRNKYRKLDDFENREAPALKLIGHKPQNDYNGW